MSWSIAVGGATGNVGTEMIRTLEARDFPVDRFVPLASQRSAGAGAKVEFRGRSYPVEDIATHDFGGTDILFLSTGGDNARVTAPRAADAGCTVIDNSSAFRMDPDVSLVVPEVNGHLLDGTNLALGHVFPVANCSTIQLAIVLHALRGLAPLRRVVVSTYQSASGGGRTMLNRLLSPLDPVGLDMRALMASAQASLEDGGPKPIAFNVVPQIDVFMEDGRTKEEWKMEVETRRILDLPDLPVAVTCARVPVLVGHSEAVAVEFDAPVDVAAARAALANHPGIAVMDERVEGGYATPLETAGTDDVWVSRVRKDGTVPCGLLLWIVADNVRKGAALNAVQIAERLIAGGKAKPRART